MGTQGNVNNWRKDMMEILKRFSSQGVEKVQWLTAKDEHVCPLCADREGKVYTIVEAAQEIQGVFCKPGDPGDRCRCTFVAAIESKNRPQVRSGKCPKCGFKREPDDIECPRCGIIYSKYKGAEKKRNQNIASKQPPAKKTNLTKCTDCGAGISKNAKACPHCGAPVKKKPKLGCGVIFLVMFLAIAFVVVTADKKPTKPTETPQQKSERIAKQKQERLERDAKKVNLSVSRYKAACAKYGKPPVGRERIAKYFLTDHYLKDPDSLVVEGYTPLYLGSEGWQGAIRYRAKNSFGGYVRESKRFVIRQGKIVSFE